MTKGTGRVLVTALSVGVCFLILAALFGRHYYRMTYGACLEAGPFYGPYCKAQTLQAIFQIAGVVLIAGGLWVANERRVA